MNVYLIVVNNKWQKRVEAASIGTAVNRALSREKDNRQDSAVITVKILAKNTTLKEYRERNPSK